MRYGHEEHHCLEVFQDLEWEEPECPAHKREEPECPAPKREEPERPAPKREEPERPAPKREEPERPAPKRGESVCPVSKRGESVRPVPKRGESVRPQPKRRELHRLRSVSDSGIAGYSLCFHAGSAAAAPHRTAPSLPLESLAAHSAFMLDPLLPLLTAPLRLCLWNRWLLTLLPCWIRCCCSSPHRSVSDSGIAGCSLCFHAGSAAAAPLRTAPSLTLESLAAHSASMLDPLLLLLTAPLRL
ncbi:UNVERIFIED_CONTAM: hypothetical protein FKN15_060004 [Acipenser sinensis]